MPLHQGVMAVVWLAVILLLILGASRVARLVPRFRRVSPQGGLAHAGGLAVQGSLALDLRRRVHLVEAAGHSLVILTGGTADVMIALKLPQS